MTESRAGRVIPANTTNLYLRKENETMAKAIITEVYTDHLDRYHVVYASGKERLYNWESDLPGTVRAWLEAHKEPDPELKAIQDSMTESFYEYCTGEPAPENWKEIVAEEKGEQVPSQISSQVSQASPELLPVPSQITPPALIKSGPSAAEAVSFGVCMALAYTTWIAKEAAELLILALQVLYITLSPIICEASEKLWKAWLRIYPAIVPTACKTARIAAKQAAMVVWWLWVVIA